MSPENSEVFTKENLDTYLNELSKEYKRLGGRKVPVEIILIGGAAVVENYGFRDMTTDIDAVLPAAAIMKEAINHVGDRYRLPSGWLNADFMQTASYSRNLSRYSIAYKTFNQVLQVRTVSGEYLIAMKLRAGRKYKNDYSDIVGIFAEHKQKGHPISYEDVDLAVKNLYGNWIGFPEDSVTFLKGILSVEDYASVYAQIRESEVQAKDVLLDVQDAYPGILKQDTVDSILEHKIGDKGSILVKLKNLKNAESSLLSGEQGTCEDE